MIALLAVAALALPAHHGPYLTVARAKAAISSQEAGEPTSCHRHSRIQVACVMRATGAEAAELAPWQFEEEEPSDGSEDEATWTFDATLRHGHVRVRPE